MWATTRRQQQRAAPAAPATALGRAPGCWPPRSCFGCVAGWFMAPLPSRLFSALAFSHPPPFWLLLRRLKRLPPLRTKGAVRLVAYPPTASPSPHQHPTTITQKKHTHSQEWLPPPRPPPSPWPRPAAAAAAGRGPPAIARSSSPGWRSTGPSSSTM